MERNKRITSALITVYNKDGILELAQILRSFNVKMISTGGTAEYLRKEGFEITDVSSLTHYPEIFDGRVKTLHPAVFGGILARAHLEKDVQQMKQHSITSIDLVVVDLYPFEETVKANSTEQQIIEKIDIGGVSLLRAAAKNFHDVTVVSSFSQYARIADWMQTQNGEIKPEQRRALAAEAFSITSHYDSLIFDYFNQFAQLPHLKISRLSGRQLRYGENPHQKGSFYGELDEVVEQLGGKELSYNNLLDLDAALSLISEIKQTSFVIIKHNNACGAAIHENPLSAWENALAGDPVSAFGGVIACNCPIDETLASAIQGLFFEILAAPSFTDKALEILKQKGNRILLRIKSKPVKKQLVRTAINGLLVQDDDSITENAAMMVPVTNKAPDERELADLEFAGLLAKHSKSNTIILVKEKQLIGSGTGLTSRVDALKLALRRAADFKLETRGAVMASDAFFPFPDCVEIGAEAGVTAIVQPGGSVKDQLSIDKANELNVAMCFTGFRHFKH